MSSTLDYITLANLKSAMGVTDTSVDTDGPDAITGASAALNSYLQRQVTPTQTSVIKSFEFVLGQYTVDLAPFDLQSATLVQLNPEDSSETITLTAETDYMLGPVTLFQDEGVYTEIRLSEFILPLSMRLWRFGKMRLDITGNWGFAAVPELLQRACIAAARSWMRTPWSPGYHIEIPRDGYPMPAATYELPLAAKRLADAYRRNGGFV